MMDSSAAHSLEPDCSSSSSSGSEEEGEVLEVGENCVITQGSSSDERGGEI